jgi:7-carboxy-7-deazaguanine synthase
VRVADVFLSVQGEGQFAGTPSVFVRTTGCNLRCWFCDTPYTSWRPEGRQQAWQEVRDQILKWDCPHVVLTGGEPLLQPDVVPLSEALQHQGLVVTVETAGTVYRPVAATLMSISPKLSNSVPVGDTRWSHRHHRTQDRPEIVRRLMAEYAFQLKFVIDTPADVDEAVGYLKQFPAVEPEQVWLMPQGVSPDVLAQKETWLAPLAARLGYRYCPRRQIELFGNVRGT